MKADDLLDAIGEVDDVWVKRAKEKRKLTGLCGPWWGPWPPAYAS